MTSVERITEIKARWKARHRKHPTLGESLKKLTEAVSKECSKFQFPEEDRPELYYALREVAESLKE